MTATTPAAVLATLEKVYQMALDDPRYDPQALPVVGVFNAVAVLIGHEAFTYLDRARPEWAEYNVGAVQWLWFFGTRGEQLEVIKAALAWARKQAPPARKSPR